MDESGRKILIGVLIAIVVGVGAQLVGRNADNLPSAVSLQMASAGPVDIRASSVDGGMSALASTALHAMEGVWQNSEDEKFKLEFGPGGIVLNRYDGDAFVTKRGIWGVFTTDMATQGSSAQLEDGVVYLQMTVDRESRYFQVAQVTDALNLMYLDNGSRLHFKRI